MDKKDALKRIKDEIVKIIDNKDKYNKYLEHHEAPKEFREDARYYLELYEGEEYIFLDMFLAEHDMYIIYYSIEELKDILYNRVEPEWDNEEGIYIIPERDIVIPDYY